MHCERDKSEKYGQNSFHILLFTIMETISIIKKQAKHVDILVILTDFLTLQQHQNQYQYISL